MPLAGSWDRFGTWIWRILSIPLMIFALVQIGEGLTTGVVMTFADDGGSVAYAERPVAYWGMLGMWLFVVAAAAGFFYYAWFRAPDEE